MKHSCIAVFASRLQTECLPFERGGWQEQLTECLIFDLPLHMSEQLVCNMVIIWLQHYTLQWGTTQ